MLELVFLCSPGYIHFSRRDLCAVQEADRNGPYLARKNVMFLGRYLCIVLHTSNLLFKDVWFHP